jgi:hypothetical protein
MKRAEAKKASWSALKVPLRSTVRARKGQKPKSKLVCRKHALKEHQNGKKTSQ